ncbi:MAG: HEPN domain-containing protein [Chitinivibrionia bacterium]|nr:HEPN domain-containing protein [Chitinivibrionia bacterium]
MKKEDEMRALVSKARRYLKSSDLLIQDGDYDSSVSRAYYAMFYLAEALLLGEGLSFSSHKAVIGAFGKYFVKTGKLSEELHRSLIDVFEKRQFGDYESQVYTDRETAQEVLDKAKIFVEEVGKEVKKTT